MIHLTKKQSRDYEDGVGWFLDTGDKFGIELVTARPYRRFDDIIMDPGVNVSGVGNIARRGSGLDHLDLHDAIARATLEATQIVREWRARGYTGASEGSA